jgi:hypothetical protein
MERVFRQKAADAKGAKDLPLQGAGLKPGLYKIDKGEL